MGKISAAKSQTQPASNLFMQLCHSLTFSEMMNESLSTCAKTRYLYDKYIYFKCSSYVENYEKCILNLNIKYIVMIVNRLC